MKRWPGPDPRRVWALAWKEALQIVRDPSVILVAFVLPAVMLFLFAYAVSLDIKTVPIGVVLESDGDEAHSLAAAFAATRYFVAVPTRDRRAVAADLVGGRLRGFVVIPQDFERRLWGGTPGPWVQVVTDGSQPNTASFVASYAQGVVNAWRAARRAGPVGGGIGLEPRFWFNPEIESRRFLVPGAIAVVMTIIGTLLTALVVAREWERGTMEAILSTPASVGEIIAGKLLPYLALGLGATFLSAAMAVSVFGVPLRGSWLALLALSLAFMFPALGQGLLISTLARNQFVASQLALFSGFLPAFLLSGFLFEIDSMPAPVRALTYIVAARYFVSSLQTVFLAGDVWALLLPNIGALLIIGLVLFVLVRLKTRKSLDT
ncbi:ABC-2 type transport system permease protein [Methylomagnum ishizawai]|uniref:ABC-2 type transport system permease protein n=1 Tax=Methylomagnum ishizawai TaxID=1760988 RepID=A0A1Y6D9V0_9GAMM|nr:ABC transporter permease [Methylomagnum ishizawai]SMF97453.1 ABC-2 type transport system permease protein [Methylomagnum ishizawai]